MDQTYIRYFWTVLTIVCCSYGILSGKTGTSNSGDFVERSRISSSRDISGWSGFRNRTGYDAISKSYTRFDFNGFEQIGPDEIDAERGYDQRLSVYSGKDPKISKYISYREATYSQYAEATGIRNVPNSEQLKLLTYLGVTFFDRLREFFKSPIYISSFFRTKELNERVGGAVNSDHMAIEDSAGIDIDMGGRYGPTNNQIFYHVLERMPYYKLIAEFPVKGQIRWVHVSISTDPEKNSERNTYVAEMKGKRKVYTPYEGNEYLVK